MEAFGDLILVTNWTWK